MKNKCKITKPKTATKAKLLVIVSAGCAEWELDVMYVFMYVYMYKTYGFMNLINRQQKHERQQQ